MFLGILFIYLMGIVGIGLPILALCEEKDLSLTDEMALAILIFYPITAIALLISSTIKAIKGLSNVIKLIFKGELF